MPRSRSSSAEAMHRAAALSLYGDYTVAGLRQAAVYSRSLREWADASLDAGLMIAALHDLAKERAAARLSELSEVSDGMDFDALEASIERTMLEAYVSGTEDGWVTVRRDPDGTWSASQGRRDGVHAPTDLCAPIDVASDAQDRWSEQAAAAADAEIKSRLGADFSVQPSTTDLGYVIRRGGDHGGNVVARFADLIDFPRWLTRQEGSLRRARRRINMRQRSEMEGAVSNY